MTGKRRVVITGMGVATPIGIGIQSFWDSLVEGRCGLGRVKSFDASGFASQVGGELPDFQLSDVIPKGYRKSAKVMSRDITIAVLCAYHAVVDAGLRTRCLIDRGDVQGPPNVDSTRFGANIGAGLVCADLYELAAALSTASDEKGEFSLTRWGAEGMSNLTPLWLLKFLPNMLACHVTIVHDAQAPSNTITCGEASSHLAIGEAFRIIARGDADVCICGGAESKINPMAMARPHLLERLNVADNEHPHQSSRPFGALRTGMVAAEGGGLMILESLEHARARGARIYAEIVGFGASSSSESWISPDNNGQATARSINKALSDADTQPGFIDLAAPQGLGTLIHDAAEMAGWNAVFGERLSTFPALTSRGSVGNCGAGAGAIDFSAMVLALYRNTIPPSLNTDQPDSVCKFCFAQR
ncbi:MAG: beta-ketoacyl-[acyl-carrier-protein] synthase family protein, partial [Planctomycetota bacterium]